MVCDKSFDSGYFCAKPKGHDGPHESCGGHVEQGVYYVSAVLNSTGEIMEFMLQETTARAMYGALKESSDFRDVKVVREEREQVTF